MAFSNENFAKVSEAFAEKRRQAMIRAEENARKLYAAHPEFQDIDRALSETARAVYAETLRGKEGLEARIARLRRQNEQLQQDRADCLAHFGYPADYTDPHYECAVCSDTGAVGSRMCTCFRRALVLATYQSSGIGNLLRTQSFENFDLSYYTDPASRQMAQNAYRICRQFAESFPDSGISNITLQGGTGLGKTHLSTSIAQTVIEHGYDVVYETAQNMLTDLENVRFGRSETDAAERYETCDLLIIDDLGTELSTNFAVSALYNLINTRINAGKATVVSTNLQPDEIRRRYSDRITSRLLGEYTLLPMTGTDIRSQKLKNQ